MTYGNSDYKVIVAHCGFCGRYLTPMDLFKNSYGQTRHFKCGKQVSLKPQPSIQRHNAKRKEKHRYVEK